METIEVNNIMDVPKNYTGIAEFSDGTKAWFLNDKFHRTDGPAIKFLHGENHWYLNGKLHRTDGPACEYSDGAKYWFLNGKRHRTDGPAVEYPDGAKEWYYKGVELNKNKINQFIEEFGYPIEVAIKLVVCIDCKNIKDEI